MPIQFQDIAGPSPLPAAPRPALSLPSPLPFRHGATPTASNPLAFGLFLLLNAVLFVRPSELVPDLETVPIYQIVILACLAASLPTVLFSVLSARSLTEQPITLCVLGLLPLAVLSMVGRMTLGDIWEQTAEYSKVLVYYVLLLANVNTPVRIRQFLTCLVFFIVPLTGIAVLTYHEIIAIPGLEMLREIVAGPGGIEVYSYRLRATGIFHDPNDLCLALSLGTTVCLFRFGARRLGLFRVLWLLPVVLFGYALFLTQSRGGLLGLGAGLVVLFHARFGRKKTLLLLLLCAPAAIFAVLGMRGEAFDGSEGTGQQRVQLWAEGFALFKETPFFGVGVGGFENEVHHVAHNSFIHAFVELGFLGGVLFTGAFYLAVWSLYRLGAPGLRFVDRETQRLRPYLLAIVCAFVGGILSLSRCYAVPTYLILGLSAAYIPTAVRPPLPVLHWSFHLAGRLLLVGFGVLVFFYLFTRVFVQFGR
jgi:O-antigen ligase